MLIVAATVLLTAKEFWVLDLASVTPAERAMVQSVQGIANRKGPLVWVDEGEMSKVLINRMQTQGWTMQRTTDPWRIAAAFRHLIRGSAVCNLSDESLNRAATWSGQKDLLVVDTELKARAESKGFPVIVDAREPQLPNVGRQDMAVEQPPDKPGHLRDFAIKHRLRVFWHGADDDARTKAMAQFKPGAYVVGWGPDEYRWIEAISRANGSGVAADWCTNLSAMESLGGRIRPMPKPRPETKPLEKGERVVAFVLSDGDNIQWLTGGMPVHPSYYGTPWRGQFKFTWEVSPLLAEWAPSVLDFLYEKATPQDGFVAAGAPGYSYSAFAKDPEIWAKQAAPMLRQTGLRTVGVINANEGDMAETAPLLDLKEVDAVLYKDYAPYHRRKGAIWWHNGKPCISFRYLLWENMEGSTPEDIAASVATQSSDPSNPDSYALVTVHAWSYGGIGGPIEAVKQTIERLPKGTRVVTAPELVELLKRNCSPKR